VTAGPRCARGGRRYPGRTPAAQPGSSQRKDADATRSSYTEGTPNWVDLQTTDVDAAKAFYGTIFGWTFDDRPVPDGGSYSIAMIDGDSVAAIAPQSPMLIEHKVPPMWNTYIAVDDADAAAAKVAGAGGQVLMEPFDVTDAGRMAFAATRPGRGRPLAGLRTHRCDAGQRAQRADLERADGNDLASRCLL